MTQENHFRTTLGAPGHERIKRIHFVGIGGVGMSGIAEVLLREGYVVSGSDANASASTDRLSTLGAHIAYEHHADNVENVDVLVVSTAINTENPEIQAARQKRIPIVRRAEMLAELMRFRYGIAIAGTHGKTTTTSLVSAVLAEGNLDPTFVIGGKLNSCGTNAVLGEGQYFVAEADESDASFLHLLPMMTVVTNIDVDHMDTYGGDVKKLHATFLDFLHQLPFYGLAILCVDDPGVQTILPQVGRPMKTYGLSEQADVRAIDIHHEGTRMNFTVVRGASYAPLRVTLNLPGEHNVLNALAVICVATELGISDAAIVKAFAEFAGVGRRFQMLGEFPCKGGSALLVDDYGHHPRELAATIKAARQSFPEKRLVMVFQPHRYTRTRDLFEDFVDVLNQVDVLLMLRVYAAGEEPIPHADAKTLCRSIRQRGRIDPIFIRDKETLGDVLYEVVKPDDLILASGAGDISGLVNKLVSKSKETTSA